MLLLLFVSSHSKPRQQRFSSDFYSKLGNLFTNLCHAVLADRQVHRLPVFVNLYLDTNYHLFLFFLSLPVAVFCFKKPPSFSSNVLLLQCSTVGPGPQRAAQHWLLFA